MNEDLLTLLAAALFQVPCNIAVTDAIRAEAATQAVSGLIEPDFADLRQNMRVLHEHLGLHKLLSAAGIPYVILKGYASASYYPDPMRRSLGDVDFLVPENEIDRAAGVLTAAGYELFDDTHPRHLEYRHNGVVSELHWQVNGIPSGAAGEAAKKYISTMIPEAVCKKIEGEELMLPSDFHHGLICLLHIISHMTSSGMGLRHLCDWAVFVNWIEDFPAMFQTCFEEIGIWEFAKQLTAVCCRYLGLPDKSWTGEYPPEFLEAILNDIMDAGNFGRKKEDRYSRVLLDNVENDGIAAKNSILSAMFRNMFGAVKRRWPISKKYPILLPFLWVYVCLRYAWRVLTGKRKRVSRKTFAEADRRKKLYRQFKLFE